MTSSSIPTTQRAWLVVRKGVPKDAVVLKEDHPVPSKLAKGEVLVKVQAAALNPVGYKMIGLLPNFVAKRPHTAEHDFAGIVVDANGSQWTNGQEVYGFINVPLTFKSGQGSLAEYTRVPADILIAKPDSVKPTDAAGLALAGLTAYQALFRSLKLEPGQSLFVNGGSTAVGIFAIQMAKAIGCTVTATASGAKEEFLKGLGVDRFIDYTKGPVHEQLERDPPQPKFHAILEAVGNDDWQLYTHSEKYLAPNGIFASVGPNVLQSYGTLLRLIFEVVRPRLLGGTNRKWTLVSVKPNPEDLAGFGKLVAAGEVHGVIDSVYSFEDVHQAYEKMMSGRARGKVVVKVDPSVA